MHRKDMLPQGNTDIKTVYEAKQIICPLGLEVKKIHTCKNDCILYRWVEYEDLEKWPIYELNRFNRRKVGGDDENCNQRKGGPKRPLWHFLSHPKILNFGM
jgi:GH43 family beta-xylosidase